MFFMYTFLASAHLYGLGHTSDENGGVCAVIGKAILTTFLIVHINVLLTDGIIPQVYSPISFSYQHSAGTKKAFRIFPFFPIMSYIYSIIRLTLINFDLCYTFR